MKALLEGSVAIAEAVRRCRAQVISAYPITPQTHIVEALAKLVADGDLAAQFVNVESEFAAASVVLGASAVGARAYTATTSQGLLLMTEVLFNIAGLRLPMVLTCANRAVSAPINIWNDHQDSMTVRDSGWLQLFAEDNQEAVDLHIQAYKLSEEIALPVMVCVDGFVLTHAYEPVVVPEQAEVDAFLPPYRPAFPLDPKRPLTIGPLAEPNSYLEARYETSQAIDGALGAIERISADFERHFGRTSSGLASGYRMEDADTIIVAMGSINGTIKDAVDELRDEGKAVGSLKLVSFRPLPHQLLRDRLGQARHVVVVEKAVSLGNGGILTTEIRDALYGLPDAPQVNGYVAGLGGRDITIPQIKEMALAPVQATTRFFGLNPTTTLSEVS